MKRGVDDFLGPTDKEDAFIRRYTGQRIGEELIWEVEDETVVILNRRHR